MGYYYERPLYVVLCFVAFATFVGLVVILAVNGQRDHYAKHEQEGYEAGKQGVPAEGCPYPANASAWSESGQLNVRWKKGWQRGYLERQKEQEQDRQRTTTLK